MNLSWSVVLLVAAAGCDAGGGSTGDDDDDVPPGVDARIGIDAPRDGDPEADAALADAAVPDATLIDAAVPDAAPIDAAVPDAAPIDATAPDAATADAPHDGCRVHDLTPAQACGIALTGTVTFCSADGSPSDDGALEVIRPDGSIGYLCATGWTDAGGAFYADRSHLYASRAACCGGTAAELAWPATDADFGVPYGPTRIKPWEMLTSTGGEIRENPFAVVLSNAGSAAAFEAARAQWEAWSGDGLPHTGADGNSYYFPEWLVINYVVQPTIAGDPLIAIAPEVSQDAAFTRLLGHPTVGGCASHGGAPIAYLGGMIEGTVITNHSGRFSAGSQTTPENLANVAELFNCYGITVTGTEFQHPDDY